MISLSSCYPSKMQNSFIFLWCSQENYSTLNLTGDATMTLDYRQLKKEFNQKQKEIKRSDLIKKNEDSIADKRFNEAAKKMYSRRYANQ